MIKVCSFTSVFVVKHCLKQGEIEAHAEVTEVWNYTEGDTSDSYYRFSKHLNECLKEIIHVKHMIHFR